MENKQIFMPYLKYSASERFKDKDYMICDFFECGVKQCSECAFNSHENYNLYLTSTHRREEE